MKYLKVVFVLALLSIPIAVSAEPLQSSGKIVVDNNIVIDASDIHTLHDEINGVKSELTADIGTLTTQLQTLNIQVDTLNNKYDELKKSVADAKAALAAAETEEGVATAADAAFAVITDNIHKIGGVAFKRGQDDKAANATHIINCAAIDYHGEYDGQPHSATVVCTVGDAKLQYGDSPGHYTKTKLDSYTDIGQYTQYFRCYKGSQTLLEGEVLVDIQKRSPGLTLSATEAQVYADSSMTVSAKRTYYNSAMEFTSSDPSICTVTVTNSTLSNYRISLLGIKAGTCTITCKSLESNSEREEIKTINVTVSKRVSVINCDTQAKSLFLSTSDQPSSIQVYCYGSYVGNGIQVSASSSRYATVSYGGSYITITANTYYTGTFTVYVTIPTTDKVTGASTSFQCTVKKRELDTNTYYVDPGSVTMDVGDDETAYVMIPSLYTGNLTVTSSNTSIATAYIDGRHVNIHAVKSGSCTLTVTAPAQNGFSATSRYIYVSVNRSPGSITLSQYTYTVTDNSEVTITYESTNPTVSVKSLSGKYDATVNNSTKTVTIKVKLCGVYDIPVVAQACSDYAEATATLHVDCHFWNAANNIATGTTNVFTLSYYYSKNKYNATTNPTGQLDPNVQQEVHAMYGNNYWLYKYKGLPNHWYVIAHGGRVNNTNYSAWSNNMYGADWAADCITKTIGEKYGYSNYRVINFRDDNSTEAGNWENFTWVFTYNLGLIQADANGIINFYANGNYIKNVRCIDIGDIPAYCGTDPNNARNLSSAICYPTFNGGSWSVKAGHYYLYVGRIKQKDLIAKSNGTFTSVAGLSDTYMYVNDADSYYFSYGVVYANNSNAITGISDSVLLRAYDLGTDYGYTPLQQQWLTYNSSTNKALRKNSKNSVFNVENGKYYLVNCSARGNNNQHFLDDAELQMSGGTVVCGFQTAEHTPNVVEGHKVWHRTGIIKATSDTLTFTSTNNVYTGIYKVADNLDHVNLNWTLKSDDDTLTAGKYYVVATYNNYIDVLRVNPDLFSLVGGMQNDHLYGYSTDNATWQNRFWIMFTLSDGIPAKYSNRRYIVYELGTDK